MAFRWKRVTSTAIASVGYDRKALTLAVRFKNGAIYEYYSVEPETVQAFLNASSKGKFFRSQIKDSFEYDRIR